MFYFAIPVGSGLGFISGSSISQATDSWQWGVRFSPIIGIACLGLMLWLLDEPVRGACDGARQNGDEADLIGDIKYLMSMLVCLLSEFFLIKKIGKIEEKKCVAAEFFKV